MYTPYGQDKNEGGSSYVPKKSLDELARNLGSSFSSASLRDTKSYLPYNPFDKGSKTKDSIDRDSYSLIGNMRPFTSSSIIRKNEDAHDKRYRDLDDMNEFSLRLKTNETYYINNSRTRSTSPKHSNFNNNGDDHKSQTPRNGSTRSDKSFQDKFENKSIYNNTIEVIVQICISGTDQK